MIGSWHEARLMRGRGRSVDDVRTPQPRKESAPGLPSGGVSSESTTGTRGGSNLTCEGHHRSVTGPIRAVGGVDATAESENGHSASSLSDLDSYPPAIRQAIILP